MKRIIIKLKIFERSLYRKFYQKIADKIIVKMESTTTEKSLESWYSLGMQIDIMAESKNIYLR